MRKVPYICLLALCLIGCEPRPRLIKEKDMVDIYADMFLADQWLRDHRELRSRSDTTLFFDPIFKRHGYRFIDYDYSIYYYCGRPDKYSDIVTKASEKLRAQADKWQTLYEQDIKNIQINKDNLVEFDRIDFSLDSLRLGQLDSAWGLWLKQQSLKFELVPGTLDSLRQLRDSLARQLDSLSASADSLLPSSDSLIVAKDSLNLEVSKIQIDSMPALSSRDSAEISSKPRNRLKIRKH